jgi:hypothetical protein
MQPGIVVIQMIMVFVIRVSLRFTLQGPVHYLKFFRDMLVFRFLQNNTLVGLLLVLLEVLKKTQRTMGFSMEED